MGLQRDVGSELTSAEVFGCICSELDESLIEQLKQLAIAKTRECLITLTSRARNAIWARLEVILSRLFGKLPSDGRDTAEAATAADLTRYISDLHPKFEESVICTFQEDPDKIGKKKYQ